MSNLDDGKRPMSKADADSPVLLLACRKIANQHLAVLLDNLFNNTDETLQEIVEKETSPDLRVRYAESMQKLRANRAAIVSGFESNFNSLYQGKSKRQAPPGDADSARLGKFSVDSLALVDDDALEEQIAVNNMIAAAMNRFQPPLRALKARYAVLLNAEEINDDECPVFPKAIKEAFGQAIRTVDLDILIKLTLYKLFDRFVLTQLGEMYKELNQYLVKSGILPDFKGTASRPRSEEYQQRHSLEHLQQELAAVTAASAGFGANVAGGGFGGGGFSAAGIPGLGAQGAGFSGAGAPGVGGGGAMGNASPIDSESLFNMLRQLLVMQQPAVHMAEHAAIHYETRDVVSALDNLQRTAPAGDFREVSEAGRGGQLRSNLVDVISQQRGDLESGAINAADSATVDLISMLFDVIFEDEDLPDRAKALIARLQIPLLKVAIIDPKLFEDKAHPARKLLNALTEAGVIAGEGGSGDGDTLYFKMESVVHPPGFHRRCHAAGQAAGGFQHLPGCRARAVQGRRAGEDPGRRGQGKPGACPGGHRTRHRPARWRSGIAQQGAGHAGRAVASGAANHRRAGKNGQRALAPGAGAGRGAGLEPQP